MQTKNDDPKQMEGMMMEDPGIPLNLRLVHIQNQDGDDVIRIENSDKWYAISHYQIFKNLNDFYWYIFFIPYF